MDLRVGDTERMLADSARALLARRVPPSRLQELDESKEGYDEELWVEMVQQGWTSIPFDSQAVLGHLGALVGEIGRAAVASPLFATVAAAVVTGRLGGGPQVDAVRQDVTEGRPAALIAGAYADRVAAGRGTGSITASGGPFVVEWAQRAGVLVCPIALPDRTCLLAALSPHTKGVEIEPTGSLDNERVGRVTLHGVRVPRSTRLTPEPVGRCRLAEALALIRVLRAALIVGGAQQMLDMTVEHVQGRHQFGRALGNFQAVQHACADMRIDVDAALLATGEALSRADADLPFLREAAIATFVAGRSGERAARTAAQLHGGLGFMAEYHLQHYFRRAKAARLRLGPVPDQLRDAAALLIDPAAHGERLADPARAR